jgi:hypothetical protein
MYIYNIIVLLFSCFSMLKTFMFLTIDSFSIIISLAFALIGGFAIMALYL